MLARGLFKETDPRVKILLALGYAVIVAVTSRFRLLGAAALFAAVSLWLSGLSWGYLARRLGVVNLFLLLVILTLPFTTPGAPLWAIGPLKASKAGVLLALLIFLKSNLIVLTTTALLSSSTVFELAHALHHLHVPDKLVQLLFFTFRYLHVIEREFFRLKEAAMLRGFVPRTNLMTYRTTAYLVGSLLVRSYDRAQRVYEAMLCRGFTGTFPVYRHFSWRRRDLILALIGGTYLVLMTIFC